jgi:hypothetical protein
MVTCGWLLVHSGNNFAAASSSSSRQQVMENWKFAINVVHHLAKLVPYEGIVKLLMKAAQMHRTLGIM